MDSDSKTGRRDDEIEVTPEMIEAGIKAWREGAGDEYPSSSITNGLVVDEIYRSMRLAASMASRLASKSSNR